jgi:hypothetical protein
MCPTRVLEEDAALAERPAREMSLEALGCTLPSAVDSVLVIPSPEAVILIDFRAMNQRLVEKARMRPAARMPTLSSLLTEWV